MKLNYRQISKIIDLSRRGLNYTEISKITGCGFQVIKKYVGKQRSSASKNEFVELITYLDKIKIFE